MIDGSVFLDPLISAGDVFQMTNNNISVSAKIDSFTHRTPSDVVSHLRGLQGRRIYHHVLSELRNMAIGGDAGESGHGLTVREYYYPDFTDDDFLEVLRGLGESVNV